MGRSLALSLAGLVRSVSAADLALSYGLRWLACPHFLGPRPEMLIDLIAIVHLRVEMFTVRICLNTGEHFLPK